MNTWNFDEYADMWSDMYKDAYGFRPRIDISDWSAEDFEQEFKWLGETIAENEAKAARDTFEAEVDFEIEISKAMDLGAADRDTAIRWLFEAVNLDVGHPLDREHFEWKHGLKFGYLAKAA